jgi:hypothetical protein
MLHEQSFALVLSYLGFGMAFFFMACEGPGRSRHYIAGSFLVAGCGQLCARTSIDVPVTWEHAETAAIVFAVAAALAGFLISWVRSFKGTIDGTSEPI